jgi:hypothetical protein
VAFAEDIASLGIPALRFGSRGSGDSDEINLRPINFKPGRKMSLRPLLSCAIARG